MIKRAGHLVSLLLLTLVSAATAQIDDHIELLNQAERDWLRSLDEPIIVGTERNYRPYAYLDEEGNFEGVAADYLRLLEERLGMTFVVHEYETFADMLDAARKRYIDIVPFAIASEDRSAYLNFTQPVFEARDRILVRSETAGTLEIADLAGQRVGVIEGYVAQAQIEEQYPDILLVPMPNEPTALRELSLGMLDALIVDIGVASYFIQQDGIANLRDAGEFGDVGPLTFGTRSDWPLLNSILGKGLASISTAEKDEIRRRWISIGGIDPREIERLWKQLAVAIGVIALVIVSILIWSLSLRKLVASRTVELERELGERRRVEAAKERLAVAVEQSAEYVIVIDTSGNIEYANRAFLEANGVKSLQGRRLHSMTVGDARGTLISALREIRDTGVWRGRVDLERARGVSMTVSMTIAPIHDEQGDIDGFVATARDITNEEQLESRLRQREKLTALGTLANGIAHDFNNLLVPILGYTDLIRMESGETVGSYLDAITEASERARDLVQRILIFGRGATGEKAPIDLRFEVEDAITFVKSLLPDSIVVEADLGKCASIMADRTQIQQILLNLCTNASDAMAEHGGVLTIKVGKYICKDAGESPLEELVPGEYALLTVSDTGAGMDAETCAKVFDPYYTGKRRGKGTGLGLAIVHGIVRGHGAAIRVDSEPGQGTDIRIFFPTVKAEPARIHAESGLTIPRGNGERIMVIDDDKLVLSTVAVMVKGLGYEVSEWTDPVDALDALKDAPGEFDAILTDLTMERLSGIELARHALEAAADIRVAIMTGNLGALEGYAIRCIEKPIPLAELANCLREILE